MANIIDPSVKIAKYVSIETSIKGSNLIINKNCVIDDFVKIKFVGGSGDIEIDEHVYLNSSTVIYSGNGVKIGKYSQIGPNCTISPVNHAYKKKNELIYNQRFSSSKGGIIIGEDVWIGAGVTILDGAHIGKGSVIGANSLVTGKIEEYSINVGSPCRCIDYRK